MCHTGAGHSTRGSRSAVQLLCRRTIGNKTVSRIDSPVNAINNRSMPIPVPVVGGIAVLQCGEEILVQRHCLVVSCRRGARLRGEPFPLYDRIDQFGISGREFDAAHVQIPFLGDAGNAAVSTGQRSGLDWESRARTSAPTACRRPCAPRVPRPFSRGRSHGRAESRRLAGQRTPVAAPPASAG